MANTPLPEFPGNSKLPRPQTQEERPKVEKVISGTASIKKKSIWARIGESFTGDNASNVGNYVLMDVLIPAFKTMVSEAVTQGIDRTLFGDGRRSMSRGGSYGPYSTSHTAYNRISGSASAQRPPWDTGEDRQMSRRGRATHDFREVIIPSRQEAGLVLDTLTELIDRYGVVRVSDFYNSVGMTSEYTDEKYGWNNLMEAQIIRVSSGYVIQLPPPIII